MTPQPRAHKFESVMSAATHVASRTPVYRFHASCACGWARTCSTIATHNALIELHWRTRNVPTGASS